MPDIISLIDLILKSEDDDLAKLLEAEGFINAEKTVEKINSLEDTVTNLLEVQVGFVKESVDPKLTIEQLLKNLSQILESDAFGVSATDAMQAFYNSTIPELADAYVKSIDKDLAFSTMFDTTTDWIKSWSTKLGNMLQLTSHETIASVFTKALEDGKSVEDVTRELQDNYAFGRARARRVAITETLRAHSYSKDDAFKQSPAVTKVKWKHSGGKGIDPRPHHVALNGTIIDKGSKFTIVAPTGSYECRFPRDADLPASEAVACHCVHSAVVDEGILGLTLAERQKLQAEAISEWNSKKA